MSITDELRTEASGFGKCIITSEEAHCLLAIADRIDAEHERKVADTRNDALYHANESDMAELGWVRLPKDADGETIHVGDMMERGKARGHVIALMLSNYPKKWGGALHWGIQLEGEHAPTALDGFFRHYHAPTVEDVLREFVQEFIDYATCIDDHEVTDAIEQYAKRLKLAGEGE